MNTALTVLAFLSATAVAPAATIVVSPNGALSTVQAGVTAASAGDTVIVKAGTYPGVAVIDATKTGLILKAAGKVVLDARGAGGTGLGAGLLVEATDVTIRGFTIRNAKDSMTAEGDGIRVTGARVTIENCIVRQCRDEGIDLAATDALVRKCVLIGNNVGIDLDEAHRSRIEKCVLRLNRASFSSLASDDVVVTKLVATGGGASDTLRIDGGERFTLTDAKLSDCGGITAEIVSNSATVKKVRAFRMLGGIETKGSGATLDDIEVREFRNNMTGVLINGPNTTLTRARIFGTQAEGVVVDSNATGCVVRDCRVQRSGLLDVANYFITGANTTIERCVAKDANGDGFLVESDGVTLIDCVAIDCVRDGFDVESGANLTTLDDCTARDCRAEGFDISGTNATLSNCVAKKNRLDFANDGTLSQADITFTTGSAATAPEID
ncbi:MAG: right-handed parallel beta-helix repeat-containing protein [Planctomycetes bacterium]|nr:right-handed parallel beta-helix repeat-containing protein [Planctomycetota bacterium]MCC7169825.1 right-handed parallel beta-helix repeat-containing protein [Planctomycetota bacterium]